MSVVAIRRAPAARSFGLSDARGAYWLDAGAHAAPVLRRLARSVRKVLTAVREGREASILYRQLSLMGDRELAEIGLTRSDIPAFVIGRISGGTTGQAVTATVGGESVGEAIDPDYRKAA